MGSPRILFVLPRLFSGGVERVTLHLISMLNSHGVESALAVGRRTGELVAEAEGLAPVHELAATGWHVFVPRLKQLIEAWRPTHIVTAFADVGLMTTCAIAISRHRPILVHGVHDTLSGAAARPGWRGRLRHAVTNVMAGIVFRRADAIVAVSEGVRREVLEHLGGKGATVYRIYNPIVPDGTREFTVRDPGSPKDTLRMVALGRLVRQKGFDVLIDALGEIKSPRPWTLDIFGDGPMRASLEQRVLINGLSSRVAFRGFTADPVRELAKFDLFVMPSRHEGLGNVLVEAMSCGLQVIAADCPHGPREILDNGRLGILVPPEDPVALATAIKAHVDGNFRVAQTDLIGRSLEFTVNAAFRSWCAVFDESSSPIQQGGTN